MPKVAGTLPRALSTPDFLDHAMLSLQVNDDLHSRSRPRPIASRKQSAVKPCYSAQSEDSSDEEASTETLPFPRRSNSHPQGFLLRKWGHTFPVYLEWPERNPEAFERGSKALTTLDFDAHSFSEDDLMNLVLEIFLQQALDKRLAVSVKKLKRFIMCVRHHMFQNPYHNFTHVADVVQALFTLGTKCGLLDRLSDLEAFALFAAGLCHDLEHPGVSNICVIKADPRLSEVYGEASSLEKHHSLQALSLMMHEEVALLGSLDAASYHRFRDMLTKLILATDMSRHADYISRLDHLASASSPPVHVAAETSLQLEMEILLKAADTSNVLRPMAVAKRWAVHITDEFFAQGDTERSLGLDVSPQCDRHGKTRVGLQKDFIDFVISPFYSKLGAAYPALDAALEQVRYNRRQWELCDDARLLAEQGRE